MAFVLDCSVTMAPVFIDESDQRTDMLLDELPKDLAVVPALWAMEVANTLLVATRRGRIHAREWPEVRSLLGALPVEIDTRTWEAVMVRALELAEGHELSVYDAMYLELAVRRGLSLATLDKRLADACADAGVSLRLGPGNS